MFTRWLTARREAALARWATETIWCGDGVKSLRRRLRFWDLALDAWTLNGRR